MEQLQLRLWSYDLTALYKSIMIMIIIITKTTELFIHNSVAADLLVASITHI